jgi:hypothetical protein
MFDLWNEELTREEEDRLLAQAAEEIRKRKLNVPAMLLFEMHKPLSFVGANTMVAFSPFLVPFVGFDFFNNYTRLLSKRENVERLLLMLESGEGKAQGVSEE